MRDDLSHYLSAFAQSTDLSTTFLTMLNLLLMQVSLQASLLVTLGPSFVITRFVLGKLLAVFNQVSARLPICSMG